MWDWELLKEGSIVESVGTRLTSSLRTLELAVMDHKLVASFLIIPRTWQYLYPVSRHPNFVPRSLGGPPLSLGVVDN
jgi:hypothetical protein